MQNAGLAALRLNWRYLAFEVEPSHLAEALQGARRMNFVGLNLTVPHKLLALEFMEELDDSARTWGAVNTVVFEGRVGQGEWRRVGEMDEVPSEVRSTGYNTDADAIARSVREDLGMPVEGARVLLLGAGGAGRTAALKLASEGAEELWLVNRTEAKARDVLGEIARRFPKVKACVGYPEGRVDLMLNATSLGLKADDPLPVDEGVFPLARAAAVYDMVYRPVETKLLMAARESGCRVANGLGMLLYQGAKALELWTGRPAPLEIMRQALRNTIYG